MIDFNFCIYVFHLDDSDGEEEENCGASANEAEYGKYLCCCN